MLWQERQGWVTLRIMSIHHMDTFRYWFGDPERIYCSTAPIRTNFTTPTASPATYSNRKRPATIAIDDTWTGPAREAPPADIGIKWRIECLAIGDIGWSWDPYTTPSTIRYATKVTRISLRPRGKSWFPDAFIGTMAQLLVALKPVTNRQQRPGFKHHGPSGSSVPKCRRTSGR